MFTLVAITLNFFTDCGANVGVPGIKTIVLTEKY
jgi:hypothetical protein